MSLLLASTLDLTIVIAVAFALAFALRRRSAALRHAVLAAAIAAGAALPALEIVIPQWELPIAGWLDTTPAGGSTLRFTSTAPPSPAGASLPVETSPLARMPWVNVFTMAWTLGTILSLAGLLTGLVRLCWLRARCTTLRAGPWRELADDLARRHHMRRWVEILQSPHPSLLVTFGMLQPKIILPVAASAWSDERRRVVLAHEFAHIRRHDWLMQMSAEALRAVYWFNPLVWLACRRLREESEYACDDAVLNGGIEATSYATHLLDVARHAIGQPRAWASVPAIAHPSTLERRVSAMLSQRNREPLTRRACALAVLAVMAVAVPTTAIGLAGAPERPVLTAAPAGDITLTSTTSTEAPPAPTPRVAERAPRRNAPAPAAQQTPAALSGTVYDQSSGVLPGVELKLTDTEFGVLYSAVTDGSGTFRFRELPPGRYELVTTLAGFASVSNVMSLSAGANVQRRITMPVGSLQESITVRCDAGAAAILGMPSVTAKVAGTPTGRLFVAPGPQDAPRRDWTRVTSVLAAQDQTPGRVGTPVRVGGQIRPPRALSHAKPQCPPGVLPAADTVVVLVGRIGIDGYMNDVRPVRTPPQPEFAESALDAVRQWTFTPTLLNNVAVDVNITVTVLYSR
jgi:beta-lactamase regulating signal transducer with metallopeptidase domain